MSTISQQRSSLEFPAVKEGSPTTPLDLLFIHHSCGGQLLAEPGPEDGALCVYRTHPNGGGLRARLERSGFVVHEASYGSIIGQHTDIFDWRPKFRDQMDRVLACDSQDVLFADGRRNRIVVFKSCFPNNEFRSQGTPPGNPEGPQLTVWNAKAAYTALLREFGKHPDVLFVCMTAPPLAPGISPQPRWKSVVRAMLARGVSPTESASLARQFNDWLSKAEGCLKDYPLKNVAVFDLYNILTGCGRSNFSAYSTGGGSDSHPSREGNEIAAEAFLSFLDRAARQWNNREPFGIHAVGKNER